MIFYYTEIVKDNLDITNVIGGQFVFCTDTFDVFYDRDLETRIQIDQGDVFFLNTDEDREAILNPLKNKQHFQLAFLLRSIYKDILQVQSNLSSFLK